MLFCKYFQIQNVLVAVKIAEGHSGKFFETERRNKLPSRTNHSSIQVENLENAKLSRVKFFHFVSHITAFSMFLFPFL